MAAHLMGSRGKENLSFILGKCFRLSDGSPFPRRVGSLRFAENVLQDSDKDMRAMLVDAEPVEDAQPEVF